MSDINLNNCTLELYYRSLTARVDDYGLLATAKGLTFGTCSPGGLYTTCSFYIPMRSVLDVWPFVGGQRLVVRNGLTVVWEGYITNTGRVVNELDQGALIECIGAWGDILQRQFINKRWADTRTSADPWGFYAATQDKFTTSQDGRLMMLPKQGVAYTNADAVYFYYKSPTGQTVKRVTGTYDLQEAAQNWTLGIYNETAAGNDWTVGTSGTAALDETLATPSKNILVFLSSGDTQTGVGDKTIYGSITDLVVYSELSAIDAQQIAIDIVGMITDLNASTAKIGACTRTLVPFITKGSEQAGAVLIRAFGFGGASDERWTVALLSGEGNVATPDGKPVLYAAAYPSLTDGSYDYVICLGDENIIAPVSLVVDCESLVNDVIIQYTDASGAMQELTGADDAGLTNAASIIKYGKRQAVFAIDDSDPIMASHVGTVKSVWLKDPTWVLTSPIQCKGFVRGANGQQIPTSEIVAGKRILISDFVSEPIGVFTSGTGRLTMLITSTTYSDDNGGVVSITAGPVPGLAVS